jgi:thymidine kinase
MAKLYFRHGTVGSAKTLNLLAVAHNYQQQGKKVFLMKPALDIRFSKNTIHSRAGLEKVADFLVEADTVFDFSIFRNISCVLVDEVQFLSKSIVNQLRNIAIELDIPVICYGLRTDFKSHLFEGSKRLMELADSIEEIKSTCFFCNKKSVMNMKHVNGVATVEGPSIQLGAEELYYPACYNCYINQIKKAAEIKEMAGIEKN